MGKVSVKMDGLKELKDRFSSLDLEARKRVKTAINLNAIEFQRKVRKSVSKQKGRHTRRKASKGGGYVWSSKPGTPPNRDTSKLADSIKVTYKATDKNPVAFIRAGGPGVKYARILEKSKNPNMRRPFMGPMYRKLYPVFVKRIKNAIRGVL